MKTDEEAPTTLLSVLLRCAQDEAQIVESHEHRFVRRVCTVAAKYGFKRGPALAECYCVALRAEAEWCWQAELATSSRPRCGPSYSTMKDLDQARRA